VLYALLLKACIVEDDCHSGNFTDCLSQTNPDGDCGICAVIVAEMDLLSIPAHSFVPDAEATAAAAAVFAAHYRLILTAY